MKNVQGRHFSITDPKDVSTVIYEVVETDKKRTRRQKYTQIYC